MAKPTKMRNRQIYKPTYSVRSNQISANLSKGLQSKYGRRSIRIVEGDTVKILRGAYAPVGGKVEKVDTASGRVVISGIKKEKAKGDKFDVMIHASNLLVTGLNFSDKRRRDKTGATEEYEEDDTVAAVTGVAAAGATVPKYGDDDRIDDDDELLDDDDDDDELLDDDDDDDELLDDDDDDDELLDDDDDDDDILDDDDDDELIGGDNLPKDSDGAQQTDQDSSSNNGPEQTQKIGNELQADKTEPNRSGSGT